MPNRREWSAAFTLNFERGRRSALSLPTALSRRERRASVTIEMLEKQQELV
jgi:hypothetical protein